MKMRIWIALLMFATGMGVVIWGSIIMYNYEGYLEIWREARNSALPKLLTGTFLLMIGYALAFFKSNK